MDKFVNQPLGQEVPLLLRAGLVNPCEIIVYNPGVNNVPVSSVMVPTDRCIVLGELQNRKRLDASGILIKDEYNRFGNGLIGLKIAQCSSCVLVESGMCPETLQTEVPIEGTGFPSIASKGDIVFQPLGAKLNFFKKFTPPKDCKIINENPYREAFEATGVLSVAEEESIYDEKGTNLKLKVSGFRSALCDECGTQIKEGCPFFNNPILKNQPEA